MTGRGVVVGIIVTGLIFLILMIWLSQPAESLSDYPVLVYEKGLNVSLLKNVTYSISENDFRGVNLVYFHNDEYTKKSYDGWQTYSYVKGRYEIRYWGLENKISISQATIHIYAPQTFYPEVRKILIHELEHHRCYVKRTKLEDVNTCSLRVDE